METTKVDKPFFLQKAVAIGGVTKKTTTQFDVDADSFVVFLRELYPGAKITYEDWFCTTFTVEEYTNE